MADKEKKINKPSFEKENRIVPLGYMLVIVDKFLEDSIIHVMKKYGCSAVFIKHGYGSATKSFYESTHLVEKQKALLFTLVTEEIYSTVKEKIIKKLNTSNYAKGVILFKKLSSIGGVSNYKYYTRWVYWRKRIIKH